MRINKCCYLLMAIIFLYTGCGNQTMEKKKEEMVISKGDILEDKLVEETYSIEIITYNFKNINVEYPKIKGLKNKEREKEINKIIQDYIFLEIINTDDTVQLNELNMELECYITLQSQEVLSFYYVGNSYIDGYSSFPDFYTMTLDVLHVKELKLYDFIDINEILVKRVKDATNVTNQAVESGMDKKSLIGVIQERDDEWMMECLAKEYQRFVLESDAIVIVISVPNFSGVYALVSLPGSIVDNHFIFNEPSKVAEFE